MMGNCYHKQRTTSSRSIPEHEFDQEDDVPYMLVLNSNATTASQRRVARHWWQRPFQRRREQIVTLDSTPTVSLCRLTEEELDRHVLETLSILRSSSENDTTLILRMKMFKSWANGESGWNMVLSSIVRAVPLDDVLGPSAITLFIDHCPLPTRQAVMRFVSDLNLSRSKAIEECSLRKSSKKSCRHRNICAVLGHLAEMLAGPLSIAMLTDDVLDYFMAALDVECDVVPPTNTLYSLIALEKFAQTGAHKTKILSTNIRELLCVCEQWATSEDFKRRQVGFLAQWLLDNTFIMEGRLLTYETVDLRNVNAMLNSNDVSEYLKISADGLEARSDASSFESVRCTFAVDNGAWYYEVTIVTPGVMQIGWATKDSKFFNYDGYGIGDDEYSCAYDGCRQLYWHKALSRPHSHPPWKEGDVLGLLIDLEKTEVIFSLNGNWLLPESGVFQNARSGFFAAASFMSHNQCFFNFGATPFRFPPTDREYSCFNDHAHLTDEEKLVLPKHKKHALTNQIVVDENTCDLCCDLPADTMILPCGHSGICHRCADIVDSCPLCRGEISEKLRISRN